MTAVTVRHFPMIVGGKEVDSDEVLEIRDPQNDELVATAASGGAAAIDTAVDAARAAFDAGEWSRATPAHRAQVLHAIADKLGERLDEIVELEIMANGATVRQATGFHVGYAAPHLAYFADLAARYEFEKPMPRASFPVLGRARCGASRSAWSGRSRRGTSRCCSPCGSSRRRWPSATAWSSSPTRRRRSRRWSSRRSRWSAACPRGCSTSSRAPARTPARGSRRTRASGKIGFTGSTDVGREVMRLASGTVKSVTLELGGKSPALVLDDADIELAVDGVLYGCMLYSGQVCESMTRLLLPDAIHDEFVERLVERASTIQLGDTRDWETDMGPVVSAKQHERILGYIESGKAAGATLALGGGSPRVSTAVTGSSRRSSRACATTCASPARRSSARCSR